MRSLSRGQRSELEGGILWIWRCKDPRDPRAVVFFDSLSARAKAWEAHGERIMAAWSTPFSRPRAWWIDGRGEPVPPTAGAEVALLAAAGALTRSELAMLPDALSPHVAREVAVHPDTPAGVRSRVLEFPGLLGGLTPKGIDAFLDRLPTAARSILGD